MSGANAKPTLTGEPRSGGRPGRPVRLVVNGRVHEVTLPAHRTLLEALRDLGYVDVKNGCEKGDCGACAVLLDGKVVNSCLVLAWQAEGKPITTNAGLGTVEHPHPIQEAFADAGAVQCGYCTPGMVLAAKALLDVNPNPSEAEIREAISGNLCRCTGYGQIIEAVQVAAGKLRELSGSGAKESRLLRGERAAESLRSPDGSGAVATPGASLTGERAAESLRSPDGSGAVATPRGALTQEGDVSCLPGSQEHLIRRGGEGR